MSLLLSIEADMEEVGSRPDVDDLLDDLDRTRADVLVIDLMLRGMESIEAIRAVRFAHPEMRIVVLSGCSDPSVLQRACDAGATECVLKSPDIDTTLEAIRKAERSRAV
jgi:NarL family two-component system response regulator LiaR